jgi:PucR C-terminal helix-turn-helix domain/GGDEF-like domain
MATVPGKGSAEPPYAGSMNAGREVADPLDPSVVRMAKEMKADIPLLADRLVKAILESQADYRRLDDTGLAEVRQSCQDNLIEILDDLTRGRIASGSAPFRTARRRADQGVPLGAVLHAYRLGFRVVWEEMLDRARRDGGTPMDSMLDGATALWALIDAYSEAVHHAYRETLVDRVRRDEQRQVGLLDALLEGRVEDWSLAGDTARAVGLPVVGPYIVVSAEVEADGADPLPRIDQSLRRLGMRSAWSLRPDELLGLVALGREHSLAVLRDQIGSETSARVGLSPPFARLDEIPHAVALAAIARSAAPPGAAAVTTLDARPIATLASAARAVGEDVTRAVLGPVLELDPGERSLLVETLRAWFGAGGSASEAAATLFCHRNTVRNRLARIEDLTDRSLADPRAASEIYVALETATLLGMV